MMIFDKFGNCGAVKGLIFLLSAETWHPLDLYTLKWNADDSCFGKLGPVGISRVLRDELLLYLYGNSNEAQLLIIIKALELSSCRDDVLQRNYIFESDSISMTSCSSW
uniref:Uncharacterized protein n=1 Tax=Salix viminalis TaxID=40686 RepID=A0A6N2MIQ2_SALVM